MMAAILDFCTERGFSMGGFGWTFLLWYTSNKFISDEKALLTFLSNLSRSLFTIAGNTGGHSYEDIGTQEQHKTRKVLFLQA